MGSGLSSLLPQHMATRLTPDQRNEFSEYEQSVRKEKLDDVSAYLVLTARYEKLIETQRTTQEDAQNAAEMAAKLALEDTESITKKNQENDNVSKRQRLRKSNLKKSIVGSPNSTDNSARSPTRTTSSTRNSVQSPAKRVSEGNSTRRRGSITGGDEEPTVRISRGSVSHTGDNSTAEKRRRSADEEVTVRIPRGTNNGRVRHIAPSVIAEVAEVDSPIASSALSSQFTPTDTSLDDVSRAVASTLSAFGKPFEAETMHSEVDIASPDVTENKTTLSLSPPNSTDSYVGDNQAVTNMRQPVGGPTQPICQICNRVFDSLSALTIHEQHDSNHLRAVQAANDRFTAAFARAERLGKLVRSVVTIMRTPDPLLNKFRSGMISLERWRWKRAIRYVIDRIRVRHFEARLAAIEEDSAAALERDVKLLYEGTKFFVRRGVTFHIVLYQHRLKHCLELVTAVLPGRAELAQEMVHDGRLPAVTHIYLSHPHVFNFVYGVPRVLSDVVTTAASAVTAMSAGRMDPWGRYHPAGDRCTAGGIGNTGGMNSVDAVGIAAMASMVGLGGAAMAAAARCHCFECEDAFETGRMKLREALSHLDPASAEEAVDETITVARLEEALAVFVVNQLRPVDDILGLGLPNLEFRAPRRYESPVMDCRPTNLTPLPIDWVMILRNWESRLRREENALLERTCGTEGFSSNTVAAMAAIAATSTPISNNGQSSTSKITVDSPNPSLHTESEDGPMLRSTSVDYLGDGSWNGVTPLKKRSTEDTLSPISSQERATTATTTSEVKLPYMSPSSTPQKNLVSSFGTPPKATTPLSLPEIKSPSKSQENLPPLNSIANNSFDESVSLANGSHILPSMATANKDRSRRLYDLAKDSPSPLVVPSPKASTIRHKRNSSRASFSMDDCDFPLSGKFGQLGELPTSPMASAAAAFAAPKFDNNSLFSQAGMHDSTTSSVVNTNGGLPSLQRGSSGRRWTLI